jgi:hypothetical protein
MWGGLAPGSYRAEIVTAGDNGRATTVLDGLTVSADGRLAVSFEADARGGAEFRVTCLNNG